MKILAIELGKFKSTACVFEAATGEHSFTTIRTVAADVYDLLAQNRPAGIVSEIGSAAAWVKDMAEVLNLTVQVANHDLVF